MPLHAHAQAHAAANGAYCCFMLCHLQMLESHLLLRTKAAAEYIYIYLYIIVFICSNRLYLTAPIAAQLALTKTDLINGLKDMTKCVS